MICRRRPAYGVLVRDTGLFHGHGWVVREQTLIKRIRFAPHGSCIIDQSTGTSTHAYDQTML